MAYRLVIGNKNTSSWSLRPWLAMRHAAFPSREVNINLRAPDAKAQILRHSPAGQGAGAAGGRRRVIWDSLAILEFLAETHPEAALWPSGHDGACPRPVGCRPRCIRASRPCASIAPWTSSPARPRQRCPTQSRPTSAASLPCGSDCRARFGTGGPFLFGAFSAADAMYAPVASRFRTYLPDLAAYGDDGAAQAYVDAIFALPAMAAWEAECAAEAAAATLLDPATVNSLKTLLTLTRKYVQTAIRASARGKGASMTGDTRQLLSRSLSGESLRAARRRRALHRRSAPARKSSTAPLEPELSRRRQHAEARRRSEAYQADPKDDLPRPRTTGARNTPRTPRDAKAGPQLRQEPEGHGREAAGARGAAAGVHASMAATASSTANTAGWRWSSTRSASPRSCWSRPTTRPTRTGA